jgi:EmrB/QacA subfamily drug resistance transporter
MHPSAPANKWLSFAAISCGVFLATVDGSIVNVAMPTMVRELNSNFPSVQWVVLAYLLTIVLLLPIVGRLADMYGKKHIYTLGFIFFTVASLLCGLAPGVGWLIAARVLQAFGASMVMGLGPALVAESFPVTERGKAMGLIGTVVSLGVIAGPTLGGVLIEKLSWHWIFFVNLPVGLLGAFLGFRSIPDTKPQGESGFDFPGSAALLVFLLCLLVGLTHGQTAGFLSWQVLSLFAGAIIGLALFIYLEGRARFPVIDLRLFRHREFSAGLGVGTMLFIGFSGTMFLLPFYLENVRGLTPSQTGLALVVHPIALGIVAPFAGAVSDRWGPRNITLLGLAMLVGGIIGLTTLGPETSVMGYILRILPVGFGFGLFQSPNNTSILSSAPREHWGVASGLLSISRVFGQVAGISIFGAVWAASTLSQVPQGVNAPQDPALAPPLAQMAGLHTTLMVVTVVIIGALLIQWRLGKADKPPHIDRPEEDKVVEAAALSTIGD